MMKNVFAFEIYSISPSEISANSKITIKGNFDTDFYITFEGKPIKYEFISNNLINITLPEKLEPAIYFINFYNRDNKNLLVSLPIQIKNPQPKIYEFEPSQIDYCGDDRRITILGESLKEIKYVTINGYEILDLLNSDRRLEIQIPDDLFITYQNAFLNALFFNEQKKLLGLITIPINTKPFIDNISILNSYLNYYEIEISGKNFINGIKLFVNDMEINQRYSKIIDNIYMTYGQEYLRKPMSVTPIHDSFYIVDCKKVIYTRYPLTSDNKTLNIQIESPLGQRSNIFQFQGP